MAPARRIALARRALVSASMSGTVSMTNPGGGRPASVSNREGEVGPGGINGVPSDLGDVIKLGGTGEGRV